MIVADTSLLAAFWLPGESAELAEAVKARDSVWAAPVVWRAEFRNVLAAGVRGVPPNDRGKATGLLTGGLDSGLSLGSILLGLIGDWFGYPALFATAVAGMGIGIILCWLRPPSPHGS